MMFVNLVYIFIDHATCMAYKINTMTIVNFMELIEHILKLKCLLWRLAALWEISNGLLATNFIWSTYSKAILIIVSYD